MMPPAQPIGKLFRVTLHDFAKIIQSHAMNPLVPGKPSHRVSRTIEGNISKEGDDLRLIAQFRLKPMLPIPDRGSGDTDDFGNIFLVQTEFETAATKVVAKSDGSGKILEN